ncbi:MAG TPA: flagellar hook basal-body protein [Gemmataceae bacterium]|nr:flagellar hook basal-body protein [Gemmataceae bacterium]
MIRGLYDAATALSEALVNQEVRAANLANATSTGYRSQGYAYGTFAATLDQAVAAVPTTGPGSAGVSGIFTNFDPGPVQSTGNPLDVAITGDGYFVVDGPGGQLYTRNGAFELDSQGQLQTKSGLLVRGEGGPIAIPQGTSRIIISSDGTVQADANPVGRLQLARVANPRTSLQRVGDTLFQGPPPQPQLDTADIRVLQGYREGSNVQVVNEMISMLSGMRYYEASERALRTLSEATALNTRPQ